AARRGHALRVVQTGDRRGVVLQGREEVTFALVATFPPPWSPARSSTPAPATTKEWRIRPLKRGDREAAFKLLAGEGWVVPSQDQEAVLSWVVQHPELESFVAHDSLAYEARYLSRLDLHLLLVAPAVGAFEHHRVRPGRERDRVRRWNRRPAAGVAAVDRQARSGLRLHDQVADARRSERRRGGELGRWRAHQRLHGRGGRRGALRFARGRTIPRRGSGRGVRCLREHDSLDLEGALGLELRVQLDRRSA